MPRVRITYSKSKESTYLSHLDVMNVFERSFRRANIALEYSKGYTPRPSIVFAHPLSVGIESIGEVLEVMLKEEIDLAFLIRELNIVLPDSITALSAEQVEENEKNIMSRVYAARYVIELCVEQQEERLTKQEILDKKIWYQKELEDYLSQEFVLVLKKSKERNERIDIKSMIKEYSFTIDHNLVVLVDTGSVSNLKPENIMIGFCEYVNEPLIYNIKREKIFFK